MTRWLLLFLIPIFASATANTSLFDAIKVTGNATFSSMTVGSVLFAGTAGLLSKDTSNFFWDATSHRLGIGTATPSGRLDLTNMDDSLVGNIVFWGMGRAANSEWVINDSTTGTMALYNINQGNYGWSSIASGGSAVGTYSLGSGNANLGLRSNAGLTAYSTLALELIASQSGDFITGYANGQGSTPFKVDVTGKGFFANLRDTALGAGVVRSNSSGDFSAAEISGDATTSGSNALTLATVNGNVGSFTNASITVNGKGLVTAASSGTAPVTSLTVATANGLAGSSSGGATPALTLSTTVTGSVCGNGTALSACTTTGSGSTVLATSPTIVTPSIAKLANLTSNGIVTTSGGDGTLSITATTGSGNVVLATSPTIVTPTIAKMANLTTNGFVKTSSGVGTLSVQTSPIPSADINAGRTINAQTGTSYTYVLGDGAAAGGHPLVTLSNASAITATVPTNASVAYPTGDQIDSCQIGAGKVTIAAAGGVTINSKGSNLSIGAQYVCVTLIKTGTNTWLLIGDLIADVLRFLGLKFYA